MIDLGKCEVCNLNGAVGVASTSMPYSCAFCLECARRGADPEIVFMCWFDDFGTKFDDMRDVDSSITFKNGKYLSYREWAIEKAVK